MNSFNHHAYGAIGDWMYRVMAGIEIDPAAPGFRHVLIQPEPGGGFTRVGAAHDSMYGRVSSSWSIEQGTFVLEVEVPANASATVRLPRAARGSVTESGQPLAVGNGIGAVRQDGDAVIAEIGSGRYRFSYVMR
jgi:alpha-L-rhamnosidase